MDHTTVDEHGRDTCPVCSRLMGYTLGDARQEAEADGYSIGSIEVTAPPKLQTPDYDDSFRVLRIGITENKRLKLLICKPL